MAIQKLIAVKEFCAHHGISAEFLFDLQHNEIIELVMIKRTSFINVKQLSYLEKVIRLYRDLQINVEGIQTILQLLATIERKETELNYLRNQLDFYNSPV